jgi:hypothetical protein
MGDPSVWRALVKEGRVAQWHVYCDNEPIREKMRYNVSEAVPPSPLSGSLN